jgi:hypothetical protein
MITSVMLYVNMDNTCRSLITNACSVQVDVWSVLMKIAALNVKALIL